MQEFCELLWAFHLSFFLWSALADTYLYVKCMNGHFETARYQNIGKHDSFEDNYQHSKSPCIISSKHRVLSIKI